MRVPNRSPNCQVKTSFCGQTYLGRISYGLEAGNLLYRGGLNLVS